MSYMNLLCQHQAELLAELGERMGIGPAEATEIGDAYFWLACLNRGTTYDKSIAKYQAQVERLSSLARKNVPKPAIEAWSFALAELKFLTPNHY